jgi:hypothetical protein
MEKRKNMKRFNIFLFNLILIFGIGAAADALAFSRVYTGNWFVSANKAFSWDFNLDGLAQDNSTDVNVEMYLEDDNDRWGEKFSLYTNESQIVNNLRVSTGIRTWKVSSGHDLNVRILGTLGDFFLNRIAVNWTIDEEKPPGTQVPEPESMLMLGFVLLGLVGVSRKRFKHRN